MKIARKDMLDMARRLYDEGTAPGHEHCQEAYLDGLWMGLTLNGMGMGVWTALEGELWNMVDAIIDGKEE